MYFYPFRKYLQDNDSLDLLPWVPPEAPYGGFSRCQGPLSVVAIWAHWLIDTTTMLDVVVLADNAAEMREALAMTGVGNGVIARHFSSSLYVRRPEIKASSFDLIIVETKTWDKCRAAIGPILRVNDKPISGIILVD